MAGAEASPSNPVLNGVSSPEEDADSVDSETSSGSSIQEKPEVSIEWSNIKVSFRVLNDAASEPDNYYDLFPVIDPAAPSSRTLHAQRRRLLKSQKDKNPMTLSNLIGGSGSGLGTRPEPVQNGVVAEPPAETPASTQDSLSPDGTSGLKKCPVCGKGFKKSMYLKRHLKAHSTEKPYKCNICNWGFFQHCNLKRHMVSHSLENGAEGFKCYVCQASFTTKSVLSVHLKDAHGEKLVTKKEQIRSQGAQRSTSAGNSPVPNISPNKQSPTKNVLNSSIGTSSNGWSRCQVCNKNFLTVANLKQHMLLHEGRKPFKCNTCGQRFSQRQFLKKHMLTHTVGGAGHPCPTCGIHFRTRVDLAQHILRQHPVGSNLNASTMQEPSQYQEQDNREYDVMDEEEEEIPAPTISEHNLSIVSSLPSSISVSSTTIEKPAPAISSQEQSSFQPFSCSICSAKFDKVAALNRHINSQHSLIQSGAGKTF